MTTKERNHNEWAVATIENVTNEAPGVKSFFFRTPFELWHLAGQHYEVRLTAENGYQAARLYSAATAGNGDSLLQLTFMEVPDGEVSPYLTHSLQMGDQVELRGPFGKFFVWKPDNTRPVVLIGGGSGIIPMHAIFTAHATAKSPAEMRLLYSTRSVEDILFKEDFIDAANVTITLTQDAPESWTGKRRRISSEHVGGVLRGLEKPLCYICGMSSFVDAASALLIEQGVEAQDILTERFG